MTFKDTQGHRYYIGGRGSHKVTGNVTTQWSAYDYLYSTFIETIRLSFSSYSELFCQKSHILTYPTCIWPMSIVATGKRLAGSSCHLVRRYRPYHRAHCARWGTKLRLSEKGTQQPPTLFGPCLLSPNGRPSQQLLSSCAKWIHVAFFDHATYRYNQLAGVGGLHRRGAELPLFEVASHGAVSSAGVLLTNQRRRVACSVDVDRFSCRRWSGNARVDADD